MCYRLIDRLSDGAFHSGEALAQELGVSRAAVWKQIRKLAGFGLDVHAVRGRGYRLSTPFEGLDADRILAAMDSAQRVRIESLHVLGEVDSTSDFLKRQGAPDEDGRFSACLAEWQRAGRGRRGRRWVSPWGANLYLSLACMLDEGVLQAGGLSLAVAIAVHRSLAGMGVGELGLKWPNDIFFQGRKLAGILLDVSGESGGNYHVVVGIGVNLRMPDIAGANIDQPWADLRMQGLEQQRNQLAGKLLESLVQVIDTFAREGLAAFADEWRRLDITHGRPVDLHTGGQQCISGVARGIDAHGALLIEQNGHTRAFHAGEVSVRLAG